MRNEELEIGFQILLVLTGFFHHYTLYENSWQRLKKNY